MIKFGSAPEHLGISVRVYSTVMQVPGNKHSDRCYLVVCILNILHFSVQCFAIVGWATESLTLSIKNVMHHEWLKNDARD